MPEKKEVEKSKESKEKSERGKKSRIAGQKFEAKVRQDLESKGWTVAKWTNTVDYDKEEKKGKLVPAKRKYNPFLKALSVATGFPDFICFRGIDKREEEETIEGTPLPEECIRKDEKKIFDVIGLEVKGDGYLDPIERGMCIWLLENKIFSRILIAKKSQEKWKIEYIDFDVKYHNKT